MAGSRDIGSNGVGLDGATSQDHLTLHEGDDAARKEIIVGLQGLVW